MAPIADEYPRSHPARPLNAMDCFRTPNTGLSVTPSPCDEDIDYAQVTRPLLSAL